MNLEQHEIRMIYFSLKLAKEKMEQELQNKVGNVTDAHFQTATNELNNLTKLYNRVQTEFNNLIGINPFTCYPNLFLPDIIAGFNANNE